MRIILILHLITRLLSIMSRHLNKHKWTGKWKNRNNFPYKVNLHLNLTEKHGSNNINTYETYQTIKFSLRLKIINRRQEILSRYMTNGKRFKYLGISALFITNKQNIFYFKFKCENVMNYFIAIKCWSYEYLY